MNSYLALRYLALAFLVVVVVALVRIDYLVLATSAKHMYEAFRHDILKIT